MQNSDLLNNNQTRTEKTLALTIASLCTTLAELLLSAIMVRLLTLEDVAVYRQTLLAYKTVVPFLGLGIAQGIYYVLSRNEHRQRSILNECMLILLGTGTLYALFICLGGRVFLANRVSNQRVEDTLLWMVPLAIITIPATLRAPIHVYKNRITQNACFSIISNFFGALSVLVVVLIFRTGSAAVSAHAVTYSLIGVFGILLTYRLIQKDGSNISKSSIITCLKVSVPLGISSMLGTLSGSLDKWIVSFLRSPEEYAIFSYGAHELPFLSSIAGAISTVIIMDMVRYTKENKYHDALNLFRKVAVTTSYFIFPVMMLFLVIAEPFYDIMYTETMRPAVPIFRIYLLMLPVRTVMYGPLMIAMGKSKQVMFRTIIGMLANLVLSIILVLWIGTVGATVASVITLYLVSVPYNLFVISREMRISIRKLLPLVHFCKCLLISLMPAIICYGLSNYIMFDNVIVKLVIISCAYAVILIPLYFIFFRNACASAIGRVRRIVNKYLFSGKRR